MKKLLLAFGLMLVAAVGFSQIGATRYTIVKTDTCGYNCIVFKLVNQMPHDGIKTMKGWLYYEPEPATVYLYNAVMLKYGHFDTTAVCPSGTSLVLNGDHLNCNGYTFKVKQW